MIYTHHCRSIHELSYINTPLQVKYIFGTTTHCTNKFEMINCIYVAAMWPLYSMYIKLGIQEDYDNKFGKNPVQNGCIATDYLKFF